MMFMTRFPAFTLQTGQLRCYHHRLHFVAFAYHLGKRKFARVQPELSHIDRYYPKRFSNKDSALVLTKLPKNLCASTAA